MVNTKISFFFSFILIKSDKQVDMTNLFNKWVVLELRNPNPFNKHVGLGLTYIVKLSTSRHGTNPTHEHELPPLKMIVN